MYFEIQTFHHGFKALHALAFIHVWLHLRIGLPLLTMFHSGLFFFFLSNIQNFSFILALRLLFPLTRMFFLMAFECWLQLIVQDSAQRALEWHFLATKSKVASHSLSVAWLCFNSFPRIYHYDSFFPLTIVNLFTLPILHERYFQGRARILFLLLSFMFSIPGWVSGTYKILKNFIADE